MKTREECLAAAGRVVAAAQERLNSMEPHEAAVAAHRPGGPSVAELEARIRAQRAQVTEDAA